MTETASMDGGNVFPCHGKRKRVQVIDLTDDVVDLTESSPRTPKALKREPNRNPQARGREFRINPIKTEARPSVTPVKQESGVQSSPRNEFKIKKPRSEEQRIPTGVKQELHDRSSSILTNSEPPPYHPVVQKECTICYDTLDTDILPLRPHTTATEDHSVCYGCWEKHLHSELERKDWNKLSCPDCGEVMNVTDICQLDVFFQERIEPKIMDKAAKAYLGQDPDWVDCPSGTCKSGAIMTDGHIFTCQECLFRYCFSCKIPMHEGEACSEYHERLRREPEKRREEELSTKTVEEVSKPCPGCTARIQKNDGCDHMTCRRCRHEFCWVCGAAYGGPRGVHHRGNDAHLETCKYASRRLPDYGGPRL